MRFVVYFALWLAVAIAAGKSGKRSQKKFALKPESPDLLGPVDSRSALDTTLEALAAKGNYIALYFTAGWCEACSFFTPQLALAHEAALERGHSLVVVVVSNARSQEESDDHFEEMPESWWRLPFEARNRAANLADLFGASNIPVLGILSPKLEMVNRQAREQVAADTTAMEFPWRPIEGENRMGDDDAGDMEPERIRTQTKHGACMWRQTGGCVSHGPREPEMDKPCSEEVEVGNSGFCDCNGDGILDDDEPGYSCDDPPGHCNEVCQASRVRDELPLESDAGSCANPNELAIQELAGFEIEGKPLDDPTKITTFRALAQEGKFLALYFGAIWCEACMQFEPKLSLASGAARAAGKPLEVILITHDKTMEECDEHFQDMPESWWRLPYSNGEREGPISHRFNVTAIPKLVMLSPALEVLNLDAREAVEEDPMATDFPWKQAAFDAPAPSVRGGLSDVESESYSSSDFEERVLQGASGGNNGEEETLWDMRKLQTEELGAHEIENAAGERTTIQSLISQGSFVGIYFAAQHCAFCSQFSPELATMQEDLVEAGNSLEIILVSSDHEGACDEHFQELPETWWRLPCNSCEYRKDAAMFAFTFDCNAVPQLAIISPEMKFLHSNAVSLIMSDPMGERFPWIGEEDRPFEVRQSDEDHSESDAVPSTGSADQALTLSQMGLLDIEGKPLDDPSATTTIRALARSGKYIGIYFSASWCDACDDFTQQLSDVTATMHEEGKHLEVVFVSNDKSEGECDEYFVDMPESWWRLPYSERDSARAVAAKFDVAQIPQLVILSPELEIVNKDAVKAVVDDPMGQEFPWHSSEYSLQQDAGASDMTEIRKLGDEPADDSSDADSLAEDNSGDEQEGSETEDDGDMMGDVR